MNTRIDMTIEDQFHPFKRYNIDDKGVDIGKFIPGNDPELINLFMNYWVQIFDDIPERGRNIDWSFNRLFTYSEYEKWYDGESQKLLDAVSSRIYGFRSQYDRSHRGYCQAILYISQVHTPKVAEFFYKPLSVRIPEKNRKLHTYIVGSTGSGKSEIMKTMIYDNIKANDSAVIIQDPKGDLAKQVARFKEFAPNGKFHDRLVYINPTEFDDMFPVFNPFDQFDDVRLAVGEMTETLANIFLEMGKSSDFTGAMESMIAPCLSLCYHHRLNLIDLYRLVDTGYMDGKKKVNPEIDDLLNKAESLENDLHRFYFKNKFPHALITTKQGIEWRIASLLYDAVFQRVTNGKSTFNLRELIDQKKVIIFSMAKGELGTRLSATLGKFIISTIQVIAQQRSKLPRNQRTPTWYYVDEFQNYVTEQMQTVLTEARAYELHMTLSQQLTGQKMDAEYVRTVMGNTDVKIMAKSTVENWEVMEKQMGLQRQQMMDLPQYNYWVKVGSGSPILIDSTNRNLLDDNNAMTDEEWTEVLKTQVDKGYYRAATPLFEVNTDLIPLPLS